MTGAGSAEQRESTLGGQRSAQSVSVVMAAYNEAEYLRGAVEAVRLGAGVNEVIVVENGSTDSTADIARTLESEMVGVRAFSLGQADYGAALKHGLRQATCDSVVIFDVDYYDLEFLRAAVARLGQQDSPAMVIGSKRAPGAHDDRSRARRLVTSIFSLVLRRGFGLHASDTHGMKALRHDAILPIVEQCRFQADLFDTELVLRSERAGLVLAEIPVTVIEQRPSRTSIFRRGMRCVVGLVRLRVAMSQDRATAAAPSQGSA